MLVTADEGMPEQHAEAIVATGITIAVIDGAHAEHGYPDEAQDAWKREIVHRWVHAMAEQTPGSIRRYSLKRHTVWKRRVRPGRRGMRASKPPSSS